MTNVIPFPLHTKSQRAPSDDALFKELQSAINSHELDINTVISSLVCVLLHVLIDKNKGEVNEAIKEFNSMKIEMRID